MSNPVLNDRFLENERVLDSAPMTVSGAINKTLILFTCLMLSAVYNFSLYVSGFVDKVQMLTIGGAIVGFVIAMVIIFSRREDWFKFLTPVYAVAEGFFIGGISAFFEAAWAGIIAQAVMGTLVTVLMMLGLYKARVIRATDKLRSVVVLATASIAVIYLIQFIASFFGRSIPQIFTSSSIGIGFSLIVVGVAALNLILDFDYIERGAEAMMSKEYEWYGAFGLMVTIVWLYIEMLHLIAKLNSRN